jgi:hypothetical protein
MSTQADARRCLRLKLWALRQPERLPQQQFIQEL